MTGETGAGGGNEDRKHNPGVEEAKTHQVHQGEHQLDDKGSDSEGDGAEEILEESPDKRWSKRREKVKQRDVPGIDAAYLAMDNETGNEVVWNEVQFSERKNYRDQEEKLKAVFDNLTHLVHINLVKFHKYWTDTKSEKPRIIFITEYMSSGSMSRFLQRARSSGTLLNVKAWKKWTTQILSALNYLHSCEPPIVHANLSCNTVFIQQNGLIKIGCVAPNAIHNHVKTFRENFKNMHYIPPEYEHLTEATTMADIYSFGICALEMAVTGALGCSNGGEGTSASSIHITPESIRKSIESLEDPHQRDFIEQCLKPEPDQRPTARDLLFHPVLFEVHSLKLISAHVIVNSKLIDQLSEDDLRVKESSSRVVATSKFKQISYAELSSFQIDLDKFLEDVRNGIYPLIAFAPLAHQPTSSAMLTSSPSMSHITKADIRTLANATDEKNQSTNSGTSGGGGLSMNPNASVSHSQGSGVSSDTAKSRVQADKHDSTHPSQSSDPALASGQASLAAGQMAADEGYHTAYSHNSSLVGGSLPPIERSQLEESRLILQMQASIEGSFLQVLLQLDDHMNRQLKTEIRDEDTADNLVTELVHHGFISQSDSQRLCQLLSEVMETSRREQQRRSPTSST